MIRRLASHRRLLEVGALAAPILIVQAMGYLFAAGPAPAPAAGPPTTETPAEPIAAGAPAKLTDEQARAADWLAKRPPLGDLHSPFDARANSPPPPPPVTNPSTPVVTPPDPRGDPKPPPRQLAPPPMRLTAIIVSNDLRMAVIDGKVLRVGQEVAPGWIVSDINARGDLVKVTGSDGQTIELRSRPD